MAFLGYKLGFPLILTVLAFNTQRTSSSYDIMKALFQWPPSYCQTKKAVCSPPILEHFIIRSVLPMYEDGGIARPIHDGHNTRDPILELTEQMFQDEEILEDMKTYWPETQQPRDMEINLAHWQYAEQQFAVCFDDFVGPLQYFKVGLAIAREIKPLAILQENEIFNVTPRNDGNYRVELIRNILIGHLKVKPEIQCSRDKYANLQLSAIAICFGKHPKVRIDCVNYFHKCPENILNMYLQFPAAEN